MDAPDSFRRYANGDRNGRVSDSGNKIFLSPQAERFIASTEGYHRVAPEKTIKMLASVLAL